MMETWPGGTDLKVYELEFDHFTGALYVQSIHPLIPSLLLHQKLPLYCLLILCEDCIVFTVTNCLITTLMLRSRAYCTIVLVDVSKCPSCSKHLTAEPNEAA